MKNNRKPLFERFLRHPPLSSAEVLASFRSRSFLLLKPLAFLTKAARLLNVPRKGMRTEGACVQWQMGAGREECDQARNAQGGGGTGSKGEIEGRWERGRDDAHVARESE
jgi:hypothetical protein